MDTLVYRFDNTEAFGLLDVEGTARSAVSVSLDGTEQARFLRVRWARGREDALGVVIVLSLPPRAVDGTPCQWLLDASANGGACRVTLEAADAYGAGVDYSLGVIHASAPRILSAPVAEPTGFWGERGETKDEPVTPPIEPYRIRLSPPDVCQSLDIIVRTLHVTGDVRLAAPGIA